MDVDLARRASALGQLAGRRRCRRRRARARRARRRRGRARRTSRRARVERGAVEARVPAPAGAGQAHAAEEAARRRVGRVEVAVGVEPQRRARRARGAATVGSVVMQIEQSRRAAGPGSARRPARRRPGRRPRAGSRATSRRSSSQSRRARLAGRADRCAARRRAAAPAAAPAPRRPRAPPGVRSDVRQRSATTRRRSPARPLRLALLEERLHALLDVLGRERDRQLRAQEVERVLEAPCPAGGTSRPCPAASAPATWPPAARPSRRPRRRTPRPATTRLTIPIRSASSAEICSPSSSSSFVFLRADVAVDQRHDHEREDADVDLGRAEARALARRRSGRRRAPAPSAPASTCPLAAHSVGLPSSPISAEQAREALDARRACATSGTSAAKPARLPPLREHLLVRGGQHDAAHRVVVARALEGGDQVVEQLVGERVARVGLVERDRRDAVGDLVAQRVVGHRGGSLPVRPGRAALQRHES